ncbi:MAG TPA: sporulation protein YtfJ [Ruminococcaceae bacterium]|jgi:sporulation protein YtfJ|nr:sporulation protein YtfJ [Oscillospiraceae bacterium]HBQ47070.1 sporulation protein YtfJ [Oscillospiraceae bacterium]HBT90976.1 sporulation protein YtfJ [Oscillospiraceae bacterium]HCB91455.1 sporulation protein YtfJ [Oscillospiraceae bacterium]
MADHPIEGMMDTTLEKIKQMVDVNSVIGDPIVTPDGITIIPISKVNYGFASGGSDLPVKTQPEKEFFGGGTGAGVTITPIAFLTISGGSVKLLRVDPGNSSADRIIELAPDLIDKIVSLFGKGKKQKQDAPKPAPASEKQS